MKTTQVVRFTVLLGLTVAALTACTGSNPMHDVPDSEQAILIGDINLNEQALEIADAVLFSNYFVHGSGVFMVDPLKQIAATDCNRDGIPLQVADLQYLIHLVVGDAIPYERLVPDTVRVHIQDGYLSVDDPVGSAFVLVEGDVEPAAVLDNLNISHSFDGTYTRILIMGDFDSVLIEGTFLQVQGEIFGIELSTYEGATILIER